MFTSSKELFFPAISLDITLHVTAASIEAKDYLITAKAYDQAGAVIDPKMLNWSYSSSLKSSFQYIPDHEGRGEIQLPTLNCKKRMSSIVLSVRKWGKTPGDLTVEDLSLVANKGKPGYVTEISKLKISKDVK